MTTDVAKVYGGALYDLAAEEGLEDRAELLVQDGRPSPSGCGCWRFPASRSPSALPCWTKRWQGCTRIL